MRTQKLSCKQAVFQANPSITLLLAQSADAGGLGLVRMVFPELSGYIGGGIKQTVRGEQEGDALAALGNVVLFRECHVYILFGISRTFKWRLHFCLQLLDQFWGYGTIFPEINVGIEWWLTVTLQ